MHVYFIYLAIFHYYAFLCTYHVFLSLRFFPCRGLIPYLGLLFSAALALSLCEGLSSIDIIKILVVCADLHSREFDHVHHQGAYFLRLHASFAWRKKLLPLFDIVRCCLSVDTFFQEFGLRMC